MHVTVTGGAGFIGSNLVRELLKEGASVAVIDDFSTGRAENLLPHPQLTVIEGDIRDEDAVRRAVRGARIVFHLAASVGNQRAIADPIGDSEINIIGTMRVLLAANEQRARKVIASSSAAVYGEARTLPIAEKAALVPRTPYAASKLAMEFQADTLAQLTGIEVACLRYFNVYGTHQRFDLYGNAIPIFARRMLDGEPIAIHGDGEQTRDFVHVDDVVAANLLAARSSRAQGMFNVASGIGVSVNALIELMGELLQRPVSTYEAGPRRGDVRHSHANISAAWRAFGYRPRVPLKDGLERYLAWFQDLAPPREPLAPSVHNEEPLYV